jgi:hypothetical protein
MSYYCSDCLVNWWPYQTRHGRCPTCGGATIESQEPPSVDADTLYYRSPAPQPASTTAAAGTPIASSSDTRPEPQSHPERGRRASSARR